MNEYFIIPLVCCTMYFVRYSPENEHGSNNKARNKSLLEIFRAQKGSLMLKGFTVVQKANYSQR